MAGFTSGGGGGFDYVQAATPTDPDVGESWFDTDGGSDGSGEAKVYDGSTWEPTGYISHDNLQNIAPADHHDPVDVSAPLTRSAQSLALAFGNALELDGSNDLAVDESAISHDNIAGVSDADHHDPVTVSAPITRTQQALALAFGNALELDGSNDLAVDESAISHDNISGVSPGDHFSPGAGLAFSGGDLTILRSGTIHVDSNGDLDVQPDSLGVGHLSFDPATQSELDSHASDNDAHHSRYTDGEAQSAVINVISQGTLTLNSSDGWTSIASGLNGRPVQVQLNPDYDGGSSAHGQIVYGNDSTTTSSMKVKVDHNNVQVKLDSGGDQHVEYKVYEVVA
ncbi:hypothetical protein QA599_17275 [Haloarculaceae archaeon H-GB1-1]|nr:hypothetical protein [Haloarculaceae archaeon H-GB1-1]